MRPSLTNRRRGATNKSMHRDHFRWHGVIHEFVESLCFDAVKMNHWRKALEYFRTTRFQKETVRLKLLPLDSESFNLSSRSYHEVDIENDPFGLRSFLFTQNLQNVKLNSHLHSTDRRKRNRISDDHLSNNPVVRGCFLLLTSDCLDTSCGTARIRSTNQTGRPCSSSGRITAICLFNDSRSSDMAPSNVMGSNALVPKSRRRSFQYSTTRRAAA
jgi:hypothetical protein